jgi:hypothetical protein
MGHYWKKIFRYYHEWQGNGTSWGYGEDYLRSLDGAHQKARLDEKKAGDVQYDIFQQLPKNYRPPSR